MTEGLTAPGVRAAFGRTAPTGLTVMPHSRGLWRLAATLALAALQRSVGDLLRLLPAATRPDLSRRRVKLTGPQDPAVWSHHSRTAARRRPAPPIGIRSSFS